MTATAALVPLNEISPLPINQDTSPWTTPKDTSDHLGGHLIATSCRSESLEPPNFTYGPDGIDISVQEKGNWVDCYV